MIKRRSKAILIFLPMARLCFQTKTFQTFGWWIKITNHQPREWTASSFTTPASSSAGSPWPSATTSRHPDYFPFWSSIDVVLVDPDFFYHWWHSTTISGWLHDFFEHFLGWSWYLSMQNMNILIISNPLSLRRQQYLVTTVRTWLPWTNWPTPQLHQVVSANSDFQDRLLGGAGKVIRHWN